MNSETIFPTRSMVFRIINTAYNENPTIKENDMNVVAMIFSARHNRKALRRLEESTEELQILIDNIKIGPKKH